MDFRQKSSPTPADGAVPDLGALSSAELIHLQALLEARESFAAFRRFLFPKLRRGWFQRELAQVLQEFYEALVAGERPKLIISAPPQHGKSRIVVEFLAWLCGRHPDMRTIYASYSDRLGVRANLTLQRTFLMPRYREVFPGFDVVVTKAALPDGSPAPQRTQTIIEFPGREGSFRNTTVLGPITGEGLDLGVIDDPLKGRKEANSTTTRESTWDWLTDDFLTRFSEYAGMLVIATRWHVDDPSGRLIEHYGAGVRVVNFKAIATEDEEHRAAGEALFPELKSIEFLEERRAVLADFEAVYQGEPTIKGGNIIKGEWFGRYSIAPILKYRKIYADTAQKTDERNDYSVFQCWGLGEDGRAYLLDQLRGKWIGGVLKTRAVEFWTKHAAVKEERRFGRLRKMLVEDKSSGTGLIQELQNPPPPLPGGPAPVVVPVAGIQRDRDRYTRCQDVLGYIQSGYVMLPAHAEFVSDLVAEAEAFTADDSHAHDDQLDPLFDAIEDMLAKPSPADRLARGL